MKPSERIVFKRFMRLGIAITVACGVGLVILTGFFAVLIYAGIPTKEAYLSVNDPSTAFSHLVAGFLAGLAWYCLKYIRSKYMITKVAAAFILAYAIGYNLIFSIHFGLLLGFLTLILGAIVGFTMTWAIWTIVKSQLPALKKVRRFVVPLIGAIVIYITSNRSQ
jgi:hypothetical protein